MSAIICKQYYCLDFHPLSNSSPHQSSWNKHHFLKRSRTRSQDLFIVQFQMSSFLGPRRVYNSKSVRRNLQFAVHWNVFGYWFVISIPSFWIVFDLYVSQEPRKFARLMYIAFVEASVAKPIYDCVRSSRQYQRVEFIAKFIVSLGNLFSRVGCSLNEYAFLYHQIWYFISITGYDNIREQTNDHIT